MSNGTYFGLWLRGRCRALGITQEELAGQVGCSLVTLQKIENGERRPSGQLAHLLAEYFKVPADEREAFVAYARTSVKEAATGPGGSAGSAGEARAGSIAGARAHWRTARLQHTNLPAVLTTLLGREHDLAALCELLAQRTTRLLTLTGPPGIGKTSLALQVASTMVERFDDGVYMIDLAPVSEPEMVIPTIARTLGLRETGTAPLDEGLFRHLGDKRMLLLLDNFEQVLDAAPSVLTLLHRSPWIKALITSREALHINGERHFTVPPLALPDQRASTDPAVLGRNPCVQLLVEQTQAIDPAFALTEDNAKDIAAICAGLDGLPLALQLAAWLVAVSPQAARNALGHRLALLKEGARDLPARHRTLRQAIEWSYDLLDQQEQAFFRRLSVFVAGFTAQAAQAVSQGYEHERRSLNSPSEEPKTVRDQGRRQTPKIPTPDRLRFAPRIQAPEPALTPPILGLLRKNLVRR